MLFGRYVQLKIKDMTWTYVCFETFFLKTGESVIAAQRAFRVHFRLRRNDPVPDRIFNL